MKTLIDTQHLEKVTYTYDSLNEWNTDCDSMIKLGWKEDLNYHDHENNKYVQIYTKEIN